MSLRCRPNLICMSVSAHASHRLEAPMISRCRRASRLANRRASIGVYSGHQCSLDSDSSAAGAPRRGVDVGTAGQAPIHGFGLPGGDPGRDRRDAPRSPPREPRTAARTTFEDDFAGRVLPFDHEAAVAYGDLFAARYRVGRPGSTADLMIASIARTKAASVVTHDTGDFEHCGLTLIDPWTAQGISD